MALLIELAVGILILFFVIGLIGAIIQGILKLIPILIGLGVLVAIGALVFSLVPGIWHFVRDLDSTAVSWLTESTGINGTVLILILAGIFLLLFALWTKFQPVLDALIEEWVRRIRSRSDRDR